MYFLDTNICAFIINGKFPHLSKIYSNCSKNRVRIPSVVLFELHYGVEKSQRREQNLTKLQKFLSEVEIVPFDTKAAKIAGQIRSELERAGTPIGGNDVMIAATALANNGTLVTNNTREFSRVKGLKFEDWTLTT